MKTVAEKLSAVREEMKKACARCGRNVSEVTLVAVTKTVSPDLIRQAMDCGAYVLGENRVQELCEKYPLIEGATWHLIGHLQTNKVKQAVGKAALIHSVDSLHLAQEIDKAAKKAGIVQQILLELNISGEESKYGLTIDEIPSIIKGIDSLENVAFKGFMTMAPLGASEEELHKIFGQARAVFEEYKTRGAEILSMGMSGDFPIAIEEGATHIRVGSAIFK